MLGNSNKGETQNGLQRIQNRNKRRSILGPHDHGKRNSNLCFQRLAEVRAASGTSLVVDGGEASLRAKKLWQFFLWCASALFHLYLHKPNKGRSERNIKREQRDKGLETNEKI